MNRAYTWITDHRRELGIGAAILIAVAVGTCAAAISYAHQNLLASAHGERGWTADVWPLTVEGIVLSAGLVLVIRRQARRSPGWLVWTAMGVGALVTLTANIASASTAADGSVDWTARLMNAWPPIAFLFAVELLVVALRPNAEDESGAAADGTVDRTAADIDRRTMNRDATDPQIIADLRSWAVDRAAAGLPRPTQQNARDAYPFGSSKIRRIFMTMGWFERSTDADHVPDEVAS